MRFTFSILALVIAVEAGAKEDTPAASEGPETVARSFIVVDALTGTVLHEKDADREQAVASTQKLLTALLIAENGQLDKRVTVSAEDRRVPERRIGLKTGQAYTRRHLLEAMLVRSGNDAARCLGRDHAGSYAAFAERMNAKAHSLGMQDSHFGNASGLTVKGQHSTARDLARLARVVYRNVRLREIMSRQKMRFHHPDGATAVLPNSNRLLGSYPDCNGMKTGYTRAAGSCLIASGASEGRHVIAIVLGSTGKGVWNDSRRLLDWALYER